MIDEAEEPLFRELEHTADLGIEVEADSLAELFRRAGLALFQLMVAPEGIESREERRETLTASTPEDLLREWLSALLLRFLVEGFVAHEIDIPEITDTTVEGRLAGEKLDLARHGFLTEIKAVTYHELSVTNVNGRWRARVIFDV